MIYLPTIWYIFTYIWYTYLHLVDIYGKGIGKVIQQQDPFRDFQSHLRLQKRPKTSHNDTKIQSSKIGR